MTVSTERIQDRAATVTRRRLLTLMSVFGLLGAGLVAGLSNLLFFRPRVTYGEPSSRFRIGKPAAFPLRHAPVR